MILGTARSGESRATPRILDAMTDFQTSATADDLWARLHRHLADFGVTGLLYGSEALPAQGSEHDITLSSYDAAYMEAKTSNGLYHADAYVQAVYVETAPILWSDASRIEQMDAAARRSFEIDCDYGVMTGVTLPMRFNNGVGMSGIGLHAAGMSWAEFDRVWLENSRAIQAICGAFDVRLREGHARELLELAPRERECLLWLAHGLRPKQIAHRLGTHVKTIEKQIESARHRLRATTTTQAVATALVYGLIAP